MGGFLVYALVLLEKSGFIDRVGNATVAATLEAAVERARLLAGGADLTIRKVSFARGVLGSRGGRSRVPPSCGKLGRCNNARQNGC